MNYAFMLSNICCVAPLSRVNMCAQGVDVLLLAAELHGLNHGDPNAGADISHQVEQAGGVAHALIRNPAVGNGSERHKNKAQRRALDHEWPPEIHRSHGQAEPRELPHGIGGRHQADA